MLSSDSVNRPTTARPKVDTQVRRFGWTVGCLISCDYDLRYPASAACPHLSTNERPPPWRHAVPQWPHHIYYVPRRRGRRRLPVHTASICVRHDVAGIGGNTGWQRRGGGQPFGRRVAARFAPPPAHLLSDISNGANACSKCAQFEQWRTRPPRSRCPPRRCAITPSHIAGGG